VFVTDNHFRLSLIFKGKAGAFPSGVQAPEGKYGSMLAIENANVEIANVTQNREPLWKGWA
jgi:hypothetical protein